MRTAAALATALLLAVPGRSSAQAPQTEDEKAIYALGVLLGRNVQFNLSKREQDILKKGLTDQLNGQKPSVNVDEVGPRIRDLEKARVGQAAGAYLEKTAKEKGVEKSESGLLYKSLKEGAGESPRATDTVRVHYRGTLTNGVEFDSSYARNEPAEFPLNRVIPCWTEGVQKMKVGGKARLVCPASIGYGEHGSPPKIPGGATLVFEVELLDIKK